MVQSQSKYHQGDQEVRVDRQDLQVQADPGHHVHLWVRFDLVHPVSDEIKLFSKKILALKLSVVSDSIQKTFDGAV